MHPKDKDNDHQPVVVTRQLEKPNRTLDHMNLSSLCPLALSDNAYDKTPVEHGLGDLHKLPGELLDQILGQLPIQSLHNFRHTNRYAAAQVDFNTKKYSFIRANYPDILRASIYTEADAFSLDHLHATLRTTKCASCSRSGQYLYLITCRRVCHYCLVTREQNRAEPSHRWRCTGLRLSQEQKTIALIRNLADKFDPAKALLNEKTYSIDNHSLMCWFLNANAKVLLAERQKRNEHVGRLIHAWGLYCQVMPNQMFYSVRDIVKHIGLGSVDGWDFYAYDFCAATTLGYMAVISAPYPRAGGGVDSGFYCQACSTDWDKYDGSEETHWRNHYTREGIEEHIRDHHGAAAFYLQMDVEGGRLCVTKRIWDPSRLCYGFSKRRWPAFAIRV